MKAKLKIEIKKKSIIQGVTILKMNKKTTNKVITKYKIYKN